MRRAKLLGGTSWLTRFTPRGSPADYDDWAARGNPGWGFDQVLPYFIRMESDTDFGDQPWHGDGGPIPSTRYLDHEYTDVAAAGLSALEAVGFPLVDDHNRPGAVGAGRMPMNSRDGVRVTTADGYLPVEGTPANLTIRAGAQVADIVFDGSRATGVRLLDETVIAAGRVVLCAGTFGNPAILMRSGIGPGEHLRSIGIPVRVDLPGVGENLADHPAVDVECDYRGTPRSDPMLHLIGTFHSSISSTEHPPDLMLWMADPEGAPATFEVVAVLLKPRSRGRVQLRSADPSEQPAIELPSLSDPADIERLAEGYRRAYAVAERPEIRHLCRGASSRQPPAAAELRDLIRSDAYSLPTWSARVRWADAPKTEPWWMSSAASTARRPSASPTRRSCPTCRRGSRMSPRS